MGKEVKDHSLALAGIASSAIITPFKNAAPLKTSMVFAIGEYRASTLSEERKKSW